VGECFRGDVGAADWILRYLRRFVEWKCPIAYSASIDYGVGLLFGSTRRVWHVFFDSVGFGGDS